MEMIGYKKLVSLLLMIVITCSVGCSKIDTVSDGKNNAKSNSITDKVEYPITPNLTAKQSSELISNAEVMEGGKIPSEAVSIMNFNSEWAYNHVPYVVEFKGKLYAMWSSGKVNEDDIGQRVMWSVSENFYNWSEPKPLFDSKMGVYSMTISSAAGFYVCGDTLYAYCVSTELKAEFLRENGTLRPEKDTTSDMILKTSTYLMSTTDGDSWSEALEVKSPFSTTQNVILGANGREFVFIGTSCRYNDDKDPLTWNVSGVDSNPLTEAGIGTICEACGFITKDNIVHMLVRNDSGYLYHAESYDNGETWSDLYKTNFAVEQSMCNAGILPDGTYYIIANSKEKETWNRMPLYLYTSKDGYNFDTRYIIRNEKDYQMQQEGIAKGGYFAYPTTQIYGDYMYIIYSKQKETIEITRINLNEIITY